MMLEAVNLTKFYGARPALDSVSFSIAAGETVCFLGMNGSGKSTIMRILTGFVAPTSGSAMVHGMDPSISAAREKFGYLPESNPLPAAMRVKEYLRFRAGIKGLRGRVARDSIRRSAERCGIMDEMATMIARLPVMKRKRVGLADSILGDPPILILDAPTAGLEPRQAERIRELVSDLGRNVTMLLSGTVLQEVERLCRRVIILNRGRLVANGKLKDLCNRNIEERIVILELQTHEPVREALRAVPGVRAVAVEQSSEDPDGVRVRLTIPAGVDLRREISALCAARGWLTTAIVLEPARLEDLFRRLT